MEEGSSPGHGKRKPRKPRPSRKALKAMRKAFPDCLVGAPGRASVVALRRSMGLRIAYAEERIQTFDFLYSAGFAIQLPKAAWEQRCFKGVNVRFFIADGSGFNVEVMRRKLSELLANGKMPDAKQVTKDIRPVIPSTKKVEKVKVMPVLQPPVKPMQAKSLSPSAAMGILQSSPSYVGSGGGTPKVQPKTKKVSRPAGRRTRRYRKGSGFVYHGA